MDKVLTSIGVEIEIDTKTAILLVAILCSPVICYFIFNVLTK